MVWGWDVRWLTREIETETKVVQENLFKEIIDLYRGPVQALMINRCIQYFIANNIACKVASCKDFELAV